MNVIHLSVDFLSLVGSLSIVGILEEEEEDSVESEWSGEEGISSGEEDEISRLGLGLGWTVSLIKDVRSALKDWSMSYVT